MGLQKSRTMTRHQNQPMSKRPMHQTTKIRNYRSSGQAKQYDYSNEHAKRRPVRCSNRTRAPTEQQGAITTQVVFAFVVF